MLDDITMLGPLFSAAYQKNMNVFGPFEKIQETEEAELYILRYPWDKGGDRPKDPEFILATQDNVLTTFGQTGLVSVVERIEKDGTLTEILRRNVQGDLEISRENMPVDGVVNDTTLTDNQLVSLIVNYVYHESKKLPDDQNNTLSSLFHYWDAERFISRFREFRALKGERDIIPDESDLTVHVKISDGCPYSCIYCPEGRKFGKPVLLDVEKIKEKIDAVRSLQLKYHAKSLDHMIEGFINTSDLLLFTEPRYSHLGVGPVEVVKYFKKTFPEVEKLGTFLSVRNIIRAAKEFGEDYFGRLAKAGLNRAYIGIETAHDEGSRLLGKSDAYQDKLYAMSLLKKYGIAVKAIIQVGVLGKGFYPLGKEIAPGNFVTSKKAARETINLMNEAQPYRVMFSEFVPYDGLPIFKYIQKGRIVPYDDPVKGIRKEIETLNKRIHLEKHRGTEYDYQQFLPKRHHH